MVTCVASADYLYWMVDNPVDIAGSETTWASAAVYQDDTKLTLHGKIWTCWVMLHRNLRVIIVLLRFTSNSITRKTV